MPSQSFRIGVSNVSIPSPTNVALPDISALTVSAASAQLDNYLVQDIKSPLDPTATYQFIVTLLGKDIVNKGYTVSKGTTATAAVAVPANTASASYGILISVPNASWSAGFDKAICAAIFMKKNAGSYQLADFAFIDPNNDFNHVVLTEPLTVDTTFTAAVLNGATDDAFGNLGSRVPYGVAFNALTPTEGGVDVNRNIDAVTVNPDTGPAFQVPVTRSTQLNFRLLANDIKDIVTAWAGEYSKYTVNGHQYEEAQMSMLTAQALITENAPIKLTMPINKFGKQEVRIYVGGFIENLTAWVEAWRKDATTPVTIQYSTVSLDKLIINKHVEVIYRKDS